MGRPAKLITVDGVTKPIREWSSLCGYCETYFSDISRKLNSEEELIERIRSSIQNTGNKKYSGSRSKFLTYNRETKTTSEWSTCLGYSRSYITTIYKNQGKDAALEFIASKLSGKRQTVGGKKVNYITVGEEEKTAYQWAKALGCAPNYISRIIKEKGEAAAVDFITKHLSEDTPVARKKHLITINGTTMTIAEWAKKTGCCVTTLYKIFNKEGSEAVVNYINDFVEGKIAQKKHYEIGDITVNGETHTRNEWSEIIGISTARLFCVFKKDGKEGLVKYIETKLIQNKKKPEDRFVVIKPDYAPLNTNRKNNKWQSEHLKKSYGTMLRCCYGSLRRITKPLNPDIIICEEWLKEPSAFEKWAFDNGYEDGATYIKRQDESKGFNPENCYIRQNAKSIYITVNGITKNIKSWNEYLDYGTGYLSSIYQKQGEEAVINTISKNFNKRSKTHKDAIYVR